MATSIARVVPDSNVFIAGALTRGIAYDFLFGNQTLAPLRYKPYTSAVILLEVQGKLESVFGFDRKTTAAFMSDLQAVCTVVIPTSKIDVARDQDDNKIIECALEAKAHMIITYDKDLLSLKQYQDIAMIHPRMIKHWFLSREK